MKIIFILAFILCLSLAYAQLDRQMFNSFMAQYNKMYKSREEFRKRFSIFQSNLKIIEKLNAQSGTNGATYGINQFSDLTPEEFSHLYLMKNFKGGNKKEGKLLPVSQETLNAPLPTNFDWRDQKPFPVTPVKNQGQCGSCWAFSTTEEVESVWILANNSRQILSEQQIVDCDTTDDGCNGGDTTTAYAYVIQAGGLETEKSYPYTATNQNCQFQSSLVVASISNWYYVTQTNNETHMQVSLYNTAPISICVDASSWQFYNGGIIKNNCGQNLDHCVQLTGFGTSDGTPFWWIRNSWGTSWGQQGYLQVERNKNLCGVSDEATIAQAKSSDK